ncbi:MAG: FISUMP domain-containing protein, partial [Candidatus Saccharibacteria bacterium]|nr:FISUMP domain-containing protein [Candidatus Saccharibacteria bacterium]
VSSTIPTKTGYTFNGWCTVQVSADSACSGTKVNAGSTYNFIDQTASSNVVDLYAMWNTWTYTLNLDFDGSTGISSVMFNGNVYVNDRDSYTIPGLKYGESYHINAALDMGYDFQSWMYSGGIIDDPTSAPASFIYYPTQNNTTVSIHPTALGKTFSGYIATSEGISSVRINGGSLCTSSTGCLEALRWGNSYTLTATVEPGYTLVGLDGNNPCPYNGYTVSGNVVSNIHIENNPCASDTMSLFQEIRAVATPNTYSATIKPGAGISSVNISGNGVNTTCTSTSGCNVAVTYGKTYTLTASAAVDYRFSDWSNNSSYGSFSSTTDNPASFTIGAGDATITANGVPTKVSITINPTGETSRIVGLSLVRGMTSSGAVATDITSSRTIRVDAGVNYQIQCIPDAWYVCDYSGTGGGSGINSYIDFTPTSDAVVNVAIKANDSGNDYLDYLHEITGKFGDMGDIGLTGSEFQTKWGISKSVIRHGGYIDERILSMDRGLYWPVNDNGRDGREYMVGLLKDGNIWMVDNLRLSPGTYNSTNSNSQGSFVIQELDCDSMNTSCMYNNFQTTDKHHLGYSTGNMGIQYNYYAASAGTYDSSIDATLTYDICPKGWHMPTTDQVQNLLNLYGSEYRATDALGISISPMKSGSTITNNDTSFYFWTRTYYSSEPDAYDGVFDNGVDRLSSFWLNDGFSGDSRMGVRCVMDNWN